MSTHNICFVFCFVFSGEIRKKKYQYFWVDIFEAILSNFFTFIDNKSRMTQMHVDSFEFHPFITCLLK